MEIKNFNPGDENAIMQLFHTVFKRPMSHQYWKWRFEDNPAGKYMIKLMWDNEKLVGHYAVSPVELFLNNKIYLSALSMATMTHPDYGGKGIFGSLANDLYNQLEQNPNFVAVWGFPNLNSHYGFIKNLDWKDLAQIIHLTIHSSKISKKSNDKILLCSEFSQLHEDIMSVVTSQFPVAVHRTKEYFNWRYISNPNNKYYIFELNNGNVNDSAFIVVKQYPDQINPNIKNIYITELGIQKHQLDLLPYFLSTIADYFDQPGSTINLWLSIFDNRFIFFEKIGFEPIGKQTYLSLRSHHTLSALLVDYRNWYISYSDSDIY